LAYKKKNNIYGVWWLLGLTLVVLSVAQEKPKQKLILFLTEPVTTQEVSVRVEENFQTSGRLNSKVKVEKLKIKNLNVLTYKVGQGNKQNLTLELIQNGFVRLEVHDFSGKFLGVLFENHLVKGQYVFEEDGRWERFKSLKGIAFLTLYIDNKKVLKKLVAKME